MPVIFENAPLVEMLVELQWTPSAFVAAGTNQALTGQGKLGILNFAASETFFQKLLMKADTIGFSSSERLVPQGFPIIPNQIVYRMRAEGGARLLQIGVGVISANAVPPYHSWAQFEPTLHRSFSAAFEVLRSFGEFTSLNAVKLRYIDAFTSAQIGDLDPSAFMQDVLKLRPNIPEIIAKHLDRDKIVRPQMQIMFPLQDELTLSIVAGEGLSQGQRALILNSTVSSGRTAVDEVFSKPERHHQIIHEVFVELVRPVHGVLRAKEVGS